MKVLKVFALICGVLLFVLAGLLAAARYFFPEEAIRQQLEQVLSQQMNGTVRVASIKWDLLNGVRIGRVEIDRDDVQLAKFDELLLHYNLWHLIHGELVITELVLEGAGVFLALPTSVTSPNVEQPPEAPTPTTLPTLPIAIDLQSVRIVDTEVAITREDGLRLALHQVNLTAGLSAGPRNVELSGNLDVGGIEIQLNENQLKVPLRVEFTLGADLAEEQLVVDRLEITSDPLLKLTLAGQVDHFASTRELILSVEDSEIDLEPLLVLVMPFVPEDLTDARLAGMISPKLTVKGRHQEDGFTGTIDLDLRGQAVSGTIPAFQAALDTATFQLRTGETPVHANLPSSIQADISVTSEKASFQTVSLGNLDLQVGVHQVELGKFSAHMGLTGVLSTPRLSGIEPLSEPVELAIEAEGNTTLESASLRKVSARIGNLLSLEATGDIGATDGAGGEHPVALDASIVTDLARIISAIPPAAIHGITVNSPNIRQELTFTVKGTLDPQFRPQRADARGELTVSGLQISSAELAIGGRLEQFRVGMKSTYRAETESLDSTVTGEIALEDWKHGATFALKQARLKFQTELSGKLSQNMELRQLKASNRLDLQTRRLGYSGPDVAGRLEQLSLAASSSANLVEGSYILESLRLTADRLLDVAGKANFNSQNRQFSADFSMRSFNFAELRSHLSGAKVETLSAVNPKGQLSILLRASGSLPKPEQLTALQIPVALTMDIELHDVAGAFGSQSVTGANGMIRLSSEPQNRQRSLVSWNLRASRLNLGDSLPIHQLDGFSSAADISAEEFDSLILDDLRIGAEGVALSVKGEFSGIKRLLMKKEGSALASLGSLFLKFHSKIDLDLDRVPDIARSFGFTGSGRASVSAQLFKKERGPLDVRLNVQPQGLSVTKNAARVVDFNGTITTRKILQWLPNLDGVSPDTALAPTDILPELRASTSSHRALRIRQLEVQGIQIRDLSAILSFDQDRFMVQDLAMTILDGGLGGEFVLTGGKSFSLDTRLEAARLDLNGLLPQEQQVKGDSLVDATVSLFAAFEPDQGRLDFSRSKLDLHLTRIGRETLNRVLQFLDPNGSNPSIVGARSAIQLANPSAARVTMFKGLVGLQIEFQEGLLARFEMDRIPVSKIRQIRDITQTVPQWAAIRGMMQLLGATRYGVDQVGTFVLE